MVRRCGILAGMPVSTGLPARVALVERRHVDLMRVSGCQCCCPQRMR
ncbi:MAG: putative leader peptide [Actinomycetes bacterium]